MAFYIRWDGRSVARRKPVFPWEKKRSPCHQSICPGLTGGQVWADNRTARWTEHGPPRPTTREKATKEKNKKRKRNARIPIAPHEPAFIGVASPRWLGVRSLGDPSVKRTLVPALHNPSAKAGRSHRQ